jgi:hypothetical protein
MTSSVAEGKTWQTQHQEKAHQGGAPGAQGEI